jgi:hypothetical protein
METPLQEAQRALAPPKSFADTWVATDRPHVWAGKEFGFGDLLDVVNPLQHIPVVSTIYRALTGDTIGNAPRVIGDALFGGPIGFVTGLVQVAMKEETGKDIGEHVLALATGGSAGGETAAASAVAAAPAAADDAPAAAAAATEKAAPIAAKVAAAAPAAPPPVVLDHAPMPLFRSVARAGAAPGGSADARQLSSRVVPLQTSLPVVPTRPVAAAAYAPKPAAGPSGEAPVDISQRMLTALDKYMRLQQEKGGLGAAPRGGQLDVSE